MRRGARFYTWLFRIAVNLALSERRARRRKPHISLDGDGPSGRAAAATVRSENEDVGRRVELQELYGRVEAALSRLEPEFRAAVVLKDIEGLDYASIAAILHVAVGTVKSRIFRGRTMLREMLTEERNELGSRKA